MEPPNSCEDCSSRDKSVRLVTNKEHFDINGWVRIAHAFMADEAAAMREVVWEALESVGVLRNDPATWLVERPWHLQHLKANPVFRAVGSERTLTAIDDVLGGQSWRRPLDWGA